MTETGESALVFLNADAAAGEEDRAFVAVVRSREEFQRWLSASPPQLQWLQVEELLCDSEAWAAAAQGTSDVPLDVVMSNPEAEFSQLYRLVDVRAARDVRVSIPAAPGFGKAVRLAASLGLPIRILPGQPTEEVLAQLEQVAEFYLRDPMVEAPIEPFHSLLAAQRGGGSETLWRILEVDPDVFARFDANGHAILPRSTQPAPPMFVRSHLSHLLERGAECALCPWQESCAGYFKWPDPKYSCGGVKQLFARIKAAADELTEDLADTEKLTQ